MKTNLPEAFLADLAPYMPADELARFVEALADSEPTTSIRLNPRKMPQLPLHLQQAGATPIPWNPELGYYLAERPNFTLDPLLHAGCYYVQEASSQFVTHVVRSVVPTDRPLRVLDLCAAPGGKSTALLSTLPEGSHVTSNEIDRRRARILAENITKWGYPESRVTASAPADFTSQGPTYDLILTDVPCSGEGMFRKDDEAVREWSPRKVQECVALQRQILDAIWPCLKPGGILIYSTCTFNVHEDEDQLQYLCEAFDAEVLDIPVQPAWHIHAPLVGNRPCCRFMPHTTRGEGLFMAAVRKPGEATDSEAPVCRLHKNKKDRKKQPDTSVYVLQDGIEPPVQKGRDLIPSHSMALATCLTPTDYPQIELPLQTALQYLRREAILLPEDAPHGYVIVTYEGHPLGFVKNMGNRSNNLYPQEWRIRYC